MLLSSIKKHVPDLKSSIIKKSSHKKRNCFLLKKYHMRYTPNIETLSAQSSAEVPQKGKKP